MAVDNVIYSYYENLVSSDEDEDRSYLNYEDEIRDFRFDRFLFDSVFRNRLVGVFTPNYKTIKILSKIFKYYDENKDKISNKNERDTFRKQRKILLESGLFDEVFNKEEKKEEKFSEKWAFSQLVNIRKEKTSLYNFLKIVFTNIDVVKSFNNKDGFMNTLRDLVDKFGKDKSITLFDQVENQV